MKKIAILILVASCQSEAGKKAAAEVAAMEEKLKIQKHYNKCLDWRLKLEAAGLSSEEAARKEDSLDATCHCLDSLNAQKMRDNK